MTTTGVTTTGVTTVTAINPERLLRLYRDFILQGKKIRSVCEQSGGVRGSLRFSFLRPEDLVVLCFELVNLKFEEPAEEDPDEEAPRRLVRSAQNATAYLIAHHQPQSILEESFFEAEPDVDVSAEQKSGDNPVYDHTAPKDIDDADLQNQLANDDALGEPPVDTRMAGFSRVAVRMPAEQAGLDLTAEAFLEALRSWPMSLAPTALPAPSSFEYVAVDDIGGLKDAGVTLVESLQKALSEVVGDELEKVAAAAELDTGASDVKAAISASAQEAAAAVATEIAGGITALARGGADGTDADEPVGRAVAMAATEFRARVEPTLASELLERLDGALKLILRPRQPAATHTAIELPYRLIISPNRFAGWAHADKPVDHGGRTELWHSRLGVRRPNGGIDEVSEFQKNIRAIWTPDYEKPVVSPHQDHPFRAPLTARDRAMLVRLTAGYDEPDFTPLPVDTHRLMLSAQGGWLDAEKSWRQLPFGIELEGWTHRSTLARDHYVRVVYRGFMFPFRNAASLIKVTERKFKSKGRRRIAYLMQRFFLVIREPEMFFPGQGQSFAGRQFPFRRIRILTTVTPNLDDPNANGVEQFLDDSSLAQPLNGYSGQDAFWPRVGGSDFAFQITAEDLAGHKHSFTAPLMFLSVAGGPTGDKPIPVTEDKIAAIRAIYLEDSAIAQERRKRGFGGQTVQYAESLEAGDVSFETAAIEFAGQAPDAGHGLGNQRPHFYPAVHSADLNIPAVDRLLGKGGAKSFEYHGPAEGGPPAPNYLQEGFTGGNRGEVLFKAAGAALDVAFDAQNNGDKVGGLATPNLSVSALSRRKGPMGGALEAATGGSFDPADVFGGQDANILGGLSLIDILKPIADILLGGVEEAVPKLQTTEFPDRIETAYRWKTDQVKGDPANLFVPNAGGKTTQLDISTTLTTPLSAGGGTPSTTTNAKLNDFKVNMFGFIILWFDNLSFVSTDGAKPDVDVDLNPDEPLTFGGPLEFVNELRKFLPADGFSDPPDIDITPAGLQASYSLGLPTIAVGVFSLQNISFGAGFRLPFNGDKAVVRFAFCEREDPFVLTVSIFGGGGFFAIAVDTGGVDELEAALEFGGDLSLNVGVASGSVYVKAGIYYHWQNDVSELTGYIELGGSLSIIGLITVSLTFNMSLSYNDNGKVRGQATLIVEVEVAFFSASVSVTVERQFKGSDSDPLFVEFMPNQGYWDSYCDAFAATGAE